MPPSLLQPYNPSGLHGNDCNDIPCSADFHTPWSGIARWQIGRDRSDVARNSRPVRLVHLVRQTIFGRCQGVSELIERREKCHRMTSPALKPNQTHGRRFKMEEPYANVNAYDRLIGSEKVELQTSWAFRRTILKFPA